MSAAGANLWDDGDMKIVKKLEQLRRIASHVTLTHEGILVPLSHPLTPEESVVMEALADSLDSLARLTEIMGAAREERAPDLVAPEMRWCDHRNHTTIPWPATARLHRAVHEQALELVRRSNEERRREYDEYRAAVIALY